MNARDVLGWIVIDPDSGEWIYRCATRKEARQMALETGCVIAVIRRAN